MVRRVLLISLFVLGIVLGAWGQPQAVFAAPAAEARTAPAFKSPNGSALALASPLALEKTATLAELGYLKDETLQGVTASRTYTLSWPDAWEVQPGNTFTVDFTHSPSLETYSSLAVDFNGARLGSILLTPDNADGGSLTVNIPADQVETGYNSVRVVLYMGIHDDRCEDPNNPATWATIQSSSSFKLGYAEKEATADLGAYPAPLIDNSDLLENDVTFVLPEKPTAAELDGMALVSAKLGQLAAWRKVNFHTVAEPQATGEALKGDVIYVGAAERLQKLAAGDLPFTAIVNGKVALKSADGTVIDPKAGMVYMQPS
ncbi:MAG TPA: cellulose biosynthesis cyclic di-GMP-binding regulatory protein BcsB, partial [Anaerolineaceae bacterium]|nr:cellulose biosynthesis cyclic di-GMP-binding regulatory protein BcsB [Anaerolineaceae bacterium]